MGAGGLEYVKWRDEREMRFLVGLVDAVSERSERRVWEGRRL